MGLFDGKVAFVTGAARGMGRSHALRLAEEGADIIALDVCAEVSESVAYELASADDLDTTISEITALGRRAVKGVADVREFEQIQAVVDRGIAELGPIDIVCANAGIGSWAVSWEMSEQAWREVIDVNLTGVFNTTRATTPSMVARGVGGVIVLTSSTAGIISYPQASHYSASKHGVLGFMKAIAQELGPHGIRVNAVCPTSVNTPMIFNRGTFEMFAPGVTDAGPDALREPMAAASLLPGVPWIEPSDVSEAVVWLCSDAARYITGVALPIDAGSTIKVG